MEPEPRRWAATYTAQLKKKRKAYHDGALLLHPDSRRLVLLDDAGVTIDAKFLRASDSVSVGESIEFPCHLVDVGEAQRGHSGRSSEPAASRTAYRGGARPRQSAPNTSAPRAFVNPPKSGGGGKAEAVGSGCAKSADSACQEWHAMYTTQMTQKAKKFHDGFVRLRPMGSHSKQVVLLDEEGEVLGSRYLKSGECLETGKQCTFPNYLIEIGEAKNLNKDLDESQSEVTSSSNKPELGKSEVEAASSDGSLMGSTDSSSKEWRILYTTQLTQKAKKYHDGVLRLMQVGSHAKQIVLNNEDGVVLGSRYLKSDCWWFPDFADFQGSKSEFSTSYSQLEVGKPTFSDQGKSTFGDMDDPHKFNDFTDIQRGKSGFATSYNRPEVAKSVLNRSDDPLESCDLQNGKSPCPTSSVGKEVGISTFGRTDDSLRTASQILSIMKPPAGLSHFATQLRTSVQSCLKLDTVQAKNSISTHNWNEPSGNAYPTCDRQAIPKPAAFDGPKLAMVDIPASEMPNANKQKLESPRNLHSGNSNGTGKLLQ
ncbi:hypothetical protein ACQ4PT_036016 [Festuca glaucescens]